MASESEASCDEDPNFAVICAFFEKFGELLGVTDIDICELQTMLESTHEVHKSLMDLHVKLLRKIKKSVHLERWERSIIKFGHTFSSKDAWEVERFGYKNAKLTSKVRILKELLEAQFDLNARFKTEINKLGSNELRSQPLGRDKFGHAYWFQSDDNYQIRVFKEDLDDEKWTLVARDRVGLVSLINTLSDGDIKISSDSAGNEDSNSLSEKPIIDTGQQDTDSKKTSDDEDSNLEKKNHDIDEERTMPVLRIKNLSELLPSPKRPREEEDEGTVFQKYKIKNLEIRVSKIEKKEPIVGEAIEEPVMTVQGEGSGEDNECPIMGETIEEDVMYFYGSGNGHDCQTGNQPEEEKEDSPETSNATGEIKSTEENIPKQQNDDSTPKSNESGQPKDLNSESPKKFFFGSGSSPFISNSLSSTVAFGSPKMDKGNEENHVADGEDSNKSEKNNVDNKTVNINTPKASEEVSMKTEDKSINNEIAELLEPKEKLQGSKKETDNVDKSLKGSNNIEDNIGPNDSERKVSENTIMEPVCVKKFAYICGKDEDETDTLVKSHENVSIGTSDTIKNAETINTDKTVRDIEAVIIHESVVTTETVKTAETTETDETTETLITANIDKTTETVKTDEDNLEPFKKPKENSPETDLQKNGEDDGLDSNDLGADQDAISNLASVENDNTEKPETTTVLDKGNSDSNDKESEVQPEVVFVSGRTRGKKQLTASEGSLKLVRPIKKLAKVNTGVKKKKNKSLDREKDNKAEEKTKVNSAESSIPNSPAASLGDNSVISMGEITAGDSCDVPEADPLAVSDAEGEPKSTVTGATLTSFSLDFTDLPRPVKKIPIVPSPMRAVRKRGRDVTSLKSVEVDNGPGKRMKLKGRRQVDTALRKSVEQRIEQLHGSSSESKDSEAEQLPKNKKAGRLKKNPSKKGRRKNVSPEDADPKPKKSPQIKRDPAKKNSRILAGLAINEESSNDRPVLRQSRRLAQLKIKEQVEPAVTSVVKEEGKKKKNTNGNKFDKPEKRKRDKKGKETEVSEPEAVIETKKKKKKEKPVSRMFNEKRPWQSSSEDSEDVAEEEEEEEEIIEEDYAPLGDLKSDHEFSPESDLEDNDEDYQPMKRARTAKKESDEEEVDEFPCQKCGKEDHPEWILLCDKCNSGWHCSCLRPPLLVIPEGDWFCPPCQHIILLEQLQAKLADYDKKLSKKEVEDRRKERLAYVGISLNNVLPSKEHVDHRKKKRRHSASGSNSSSSETERSESESESDSDEPIYQLRQRRQTKNYKFNEYDEMMKTAIGEEANKPEDTAGNLGRGKDIQTIVKGLEPEPEAKKGEEDHDRPSVTNLKKMLRKKHRKLNSLEFDSEEEDISDEDFKGSSDHTEEEDDEEPDETDDSDDYMGRKRRKNVPVRRSTRARTRRYDTDFVTDDSEDEPPKSKKKKSIWDETDTEESDGSGYGPKERKKKKKKKKRKGHSDDEPSLKKNRPRIKYGGLTSSEEEELGKGRRTRGKKTTYVDTLGSDSEEEAQTKKNPRRIESDDEDFVANEEDDEGEDEEKESDDKEERAEEDEEADSEQERREKRSLLVPKIYIKKPLGAKKQRELEAAKVKAAANVGSETTTIKRPEDSKDIKINEKESELNNDENKIQNATTAKPVEYKPRAELNKPNVMEELLKDTKAASKENTVESEIKKEVEDTEDKSVKTTTESKEPNADLPLLESSVSLTKVPPKRGRKPKVVHEPIISNVTALFKNDDENDDLSEPPGISLPLFDDLSSNSANSKESSAPDTPKKRRGRGPGKKKTLEETLSSIGTKITPTKPAQPAIEIAAPPQPFSQAQPTPSVITRMLQSKPGITIYPVGRIRPKQFATMRDDDSDESSPKNSPAVSPAAAPPMSGPPNQYNIPGGPRGPPPMVGPYRPHGPPHPGMNHYPRGPPGFRGPPPPPQGMLPHPYSHHPSHRPMDPSPSGGGPINLTDPGPPSGGALAGPGRDSPGRRGPSVSRYPSVGQTSPGSIITAPRPQMQLAPQQPYPPPPSSSNGPPLTQQAYHPAPTSTNASTPQQPYPPRPTLGNNPPPQQQAYNPSSNSSSGPLPPQQSYPPPSSSNNGPPPQQPYHPRPMLSNGPPPPQQTYTASPASNNGGPPSQPAYPPRPTSNNGPPGPQQSYSPRPTSSNNGPPPSQPPEGYFGNYPPAATEEPIPPTSFQGLAPRASSPYPEQYSGEDQPPVIPPPDSSNTKAYDEESGGEFAGLASYFSSQRDDDLES